jgi:hypothetical protein
MSRRSLVRVSKLERAGADENRRFQVADKHPEAVQPETQHQGVIVIITGVPRAQSGALAVNLPS